MTTEVFTRTVDLQFVVAVVTILFYSYILFITIRSKSEVFQSAFFIIFRVTGKLAKSIGIWIEPNCQSIRSTVVAFQSSLNYIRVFEFEFVTIKFIMQDLNILSVIRGHNPSILACGFTSQMLSWQIWNVRFG